MVDFADIIMNGCCNRVCGFAFQCIYHLHYFIFVEAIFNICFLHFKNAFGHSACFVHYHILNIRKRI